MELRGITYWGSSEVSKEVEDYKRTSCHKTLRPIAIKGEITSSKMAT